MIKHPDPGRKVYLGLRVSRIKIHGHHGKEHSSRQAAMTLEPWLRSYIFSISSRQTKGDFECFKSFEISKLIVTDISPIRL